MPFPPPFRYSRPVHLFLLLPDPPPSTHAPFTSLRCWLLLCPTRPLTSLQTTFPPIPSTHALSTFLSSPLPLPPLYSRPVHLPALLIAALPRTPPDFPSNYMSPPSPALTLCPPPSPAARCAPCPGPSRPAASRQLPLPAPQLPWPWPPQPRWPPPDGPPAASLLSHATPAVVRSKSADTDVMGWAWSEQRGCSWAEGASKCSTAESRNACSKRVGHQDTVVKQVEGIKIAE